MSCVNTQKAISSLIRAFFIIRIANKLTCYFLGLDFFDGTSRFSTIIGFAHKWLFFRLKAEDIFLYKYRQHPERMLPQHIEVCNFFQGLFFPSSLERCVKNPAGFKHCIRVEI